MTRELQDIISTMVLFEIHPMITYTAAVAWSTVKSTGSEVTFSQNSVSLMELGAVLPTT